MVLRGAWQALSREHRPRSDGTFRCALYMHLKYRTSAEAFHSELYVVAGQRHSAERFRLIRGAL